ncbi:hypothetical protein Scep_010779 [Stephania cephalantha]|uniref:Uncharacterized protein n=1 Tax=Stephania cephalantha TaxID=152367 RepID=A0AAP0PDL9_9MAGN
MGTNHNRTLSLSPKSLSLTALSLSHRSLLSLSHRSPSPLSLLSHRSLSPESHSPSTLSLSLKSLSQTLNLCVALLIEAATRPSVSLSPSWEIVASEAVDFSVLMISGDKVFLKKARDIADECCSCMGYTFGIPYNMINLSLLEILIILHGQGLSSRGDVRRLTQTTPDQPVDDEAVYYKVAGECPKGRVYSLRSLGRKKRRYVDPDASTSQVLAQRGMGNFMILRDVSSPKELLEGAGDGAGPVVIFSFRSFGEPI